MEPIGKQAMELASKLYQSDTPQPESQQSTTTLRQRALVARLWEVMANTFSYKWSAAGDVDGSCFNDWLKGTADITETEFVTGVNKLATLPPGRNNEIWPPSLPEFRLLCRPPAQPAMHRPVNTLTHDGKALPPPVNLRPKTQSRAAAKHFEAFRNLTGQQA